MDKSVVAGALRSLALGLVVALPLPAASATEVTVVVDIGPGKPCTNATVKGRYSYSEQGVVYPYYPDTTIKAEFVEVGMFALDGAGGGAGKADISINGGPVRNIPLLGIKYKLNPDCTGEASFAPGGDETQRRTISVAVGDKGNQIHFISVQPGSSLRGIAQRQ